MGGSIGIVWPLPPLTESTCSSLFFYFVAHVRLL